MLLKPLYKIYLILVARCKDSSIIWVTKRTSPPQATPSVSLAVDRDLGSGLSMLRDVIKPWASRWSVKKGGLHILKSNVSELSGRNPCSNVSSGTFFTGTRLRTSFIKITIVNMAYNLHDTHVCVCARVRKAGNCQCLICDKRKLKSYNIQAVFIYKYFCIKAVNESNSISTNTINKQ